MKPFTVNMAIAVTWLLLSPAPSIGVFAIGFLIGFAFVGLFREALGGGSYVRRCFAFVRFVLVFLREFIVANIKVAGTVLFRTKETLHPNFITYDTTGLRPGEILLLSYCVTLTPGTTTVQVEGDFKTMIIHALDAQNPDAVRASIDRTLRRSILSFTR